MEFIALSTEECFLNLSNNTGESWDLSGEEESF